MSGLGVGLAIGAAALTPFAISGSGAAFGNGRTMLLCAIVGVLSTAVGYGIDQAVMRRIPIRRFALLLALLPVTAMVVGFLALSQRPSALDLAGAALVITAVIVQERDELVATLPDELPG